MPSSPPSPQTHRLLGIAILIVSAALASSWFHVSELTRYIFFCMIGVMVGAFWIRRDVYHVALEEQRERKDREKRHGQP